MSSVFTLKDGVVRDEVKRDVQAVADKAKRTEANAPLPTSAYNFADRLLSREIGGSLSRTNANVRALTAKAPVATWTTSEGRPPMLAANQRTEGLAKRAADFALRAEGFIPGGSALSAVKEASRLSEEQQNTVIADRQVEAKDDEAAARAEQAIAAEALRMTPEEWAEKTGMPAHMSPAYKAKHGMLDLEAEQAKIDADAEELVKAAKEKQNELEVMQRTGVGKPEYAWWGNAIHNFRKSALGMQTGALLGMNHYYDMIMEGVTGSPQKRSKLEAALAGVDRAVNEALPTDDIYKKDMVQQLAQASGSMTGFLVAGAATRALGLSSNMGTGIVGSMGQAHAQYADAVQNNASYLHKWVALLGGSALGLTELWQIDRMMGRMMIMRPRDVIWNLKTLVASGVEEFIQEFAQSVGEDVIPAASYDPDREIDFEKALKSGALGFITGTGTSAAMTAGAVVSGVSGYADPRLSDFDLEQLESTGRELAEQNTQGIEETLAQLRTGTEQDAATPPALDRPTQELPVIESVSEFESDPATFLQKPGWAIVTATQDKLGDFSSDENVAEQARLQEELVKRGIEFDEVEGVYAGVPDGTSYIIKADEDTAVELGRAFNQESVLTNRGLVYSDGRLVPSNPEGTIVGPDAEGAEYFSRTKAGTPFTMGLDFDAEQAAVSDAEFEAAREAEIDAQRRELTPAEQVERIGKRVSGWGSFADNYLLSDEQKKTQRADVAKKIMDLFDSLPDATEMASVAIAGRAKRGWYADASRMIVNVFGVEDAPRFTALLAALSPQLSVEGNLLNTVRVWTAWVQAQRPTSEQAIRQIMALNVQGEKGEGSVLEAWAQNTVRVLSAPPGTTAFTLSGPKVNSFMHNLLGHVAEVTNDTWMANYALWDQAMFAKSGALPGKSPGYIAMSARTRQAAAVATELTGDTWTPAEIQETVWSWVRALYNAAKEAGIEPSVYLEEIGLTDEDIAGTVDFASLLMDEAYKSILERADYDVEGAVAAGTGASAGAAGGTLGQRATPIVGDIEPHLRRAAARLDILRERRRASGEENVDEVPATEIAEDPVPAEFLGNVSDQDLDDFIDGQRAADGTPRPSAAIVDMPVPTAEDYIARSGPDKDTPGFAGGSMPVSRAGRLVLTHWAPKARDTLSPERMGTGPLRGTERQRLKGAADLARTYYGVNSPREMTNSERRKIVKGDRYDIRKQGGYLNEGVGGVRHTVVVDPNRVYNWFEDPMGLRSKLDKGKPNSEQITDYERLIKEAGFDGYYINEGPQGKTVAMFTTETPAEIVTPGEIKKLPGTPDNLTGPNENVVRAAKAYAQEMGIELTRQTEYVKVDEDRARRIAQVYEEMEHNPDDPAVRESYEALAAETMAQLDFVLATGLDIDWITEGMADPYPKGPKQVLEDLKRGHLWVFPTEQGFGTVNEAETNNPLLAETDIEIKGHKLLVNDAFRIVHDYFGHGLEGAGFGARGEENAWQAHMRLFSDAAKPAMTTETRGQNSWVNYGPHGEHNRDNPRETIFADQKTGLMPEWTWTEGVENVGVDAQTSRSRMPFAMEQTRPRKGIEGALEKMEVDPSISKLSKQLREMLGLTIRQGKLSLREAAGEFHRRTGVIRVRNVNDLSNIAHEGGHAIHDRANAATLGWIAQHKRELIELGHKLYTKGTAGMPADKRVREGFAELFRVFTTNREKLRHHYPELTSSFEQLLERHDPAMLKGLTQINDQLSLLMNLPSGRFVKSFVVSSRRQSRLAAELSDFTDMGVQDYLSEVAREAVQQTMNRWASLNTLVSDTLNAVEANTGQALDLKAADDPRVRARLLRNNSSTAFIQMKDGVAKYRTTTAVSPGLTRAMAVALGLPEGASPTDIDNERMLDFEAYLVALGVRSEIDRQSMLPRDKRMKRDPGPFHRGDAEAAIKQFEDQYGPAFIEAADMVKQYGEALWHKSYEAGLLGMTREVYEAGLAHDFYVPLLRDMSDRTNGLVAQQVGSGNPARLVKRRVGSDRDIISPLESLMHKTFAVERAIAENDIKRLLADLIDKAGPEGGAIGSRVKAHTAKGQQYTVTEVAKQLGITEDMSEVEAADLITTLSDVIGQKEMITLFRMEQASTLGTNTIVFSENGKLAMLELNDSDVARDVLNMLNGGGEETMGVGMGLLAGVSSAFRSSITSWPDFLVVNYIRDQLTAWVITDTGFVPFWDGLKGVSREVTKHEMAKIANLVGMVMGGMNVSALHEARVDNDLNSLKDRGYIVEAFRGGTKNPLNALRGLARVTELTETGTRLGIFEKAYKRAMKDGLTEYEAAIEAAYQATDYIDFGLNGSGMMQLRRAVPFLNAQLQGWYKMMRTFGADEVRQRKGLKFALGAYFKSTRGMNLSRREKMAINTGRKAFIKAVSLSLIGATLWGIFSDHPDYEDTSEYLRQTGWVIPTGEGRIIWIPKPFELALFSNIVERSLEMAWGDKAAGKRLVRGLGNSMLLPVENPLIGTMYEQVLNREGFTGREIVPNWMASMPPELQFNRYTSELAKGISAITGWSPLRVDHLLTSLGGNAMRDITTLSNLASPDRAGLGWDDIPIFRRFYRDTTRGAVSVRDMWDRISNRGSVLHTAYMRYRNKVELGDVTGANAELGKLDDKDKAYALLNTHFEAKHKRLHPLRRAADISRVVNSIRREMVTQHGLWNTDELAEPFETIKLTMGQKRIIDDYLAELSRREARNMMIAFGAEGWDDKQTVDTEITLQMLENTSPEVYNELQRRYGKMRVYDAQTVVDMWPDVQEELLVGRDEALLDLYADTAEATLP